ncbi:hypothetical protein ACRQ4B_17360 [Curtobacterium sp. SP.BCo]|uniref:hypothetical protein n=1 Tax=Curtobacterium sp. SP.BCo TaxID=3435229 RepID=UPI003F737B84
MGARENWWDDPGDDLELHPGRAPRDRTRRPPGAADLVATGLLLGAALLTAPAAWFAVVIGQLALAACAEPAPACDLRVGPAVSTWHPIATVVVLVAGVVWSIARRARQRRGWPTALATLLGVVVVFLAAAGTIQVASGGRLV